MKTLYLECNMGVSGDMLLSALAELYGGGAIDALNGIGIKGVSFVKKESVKCGISGTHIDVLINGETEETAGHAHNHSHKHLSDIESIISALDLPSNVMLGVKAIYINLANAEAKAHNKPVSQIHFHEVGNADAIADITGCCLLLDMLKPDRIIVSPVNTGFGTVKCAHGVLPVPAPATAELLKSVPVYAGDIESELTTPTGAALVTHFADGFGKMPLMKTEKIGYGMGNKDFPAANCVRAFLGESAEIGETDGEVAELSCNLDDCTPEAVSFAMEQLMANGAKDAYAYPATMKKGRPANVLVCLCDPGEASRFAALILKHTTTFGVRQTLCKRYILDRHTETIETPYGAVRVKIGEGCGVKKSKIEFDDAAAAAKRHNTDIKTIEDSVRGITGKSV